MNDKNNSCGLAYPEPKRLQLQLQPTRTPEERRLQPDSSGEGQSAPCLVKKQITNYRFKNTKIMTLIRPVADLVKLTGRKNLKEIFRLDSDSCIYLSFL